jgi:hypothetical protein
MPLGPVFRIAVALLVASSRRSRILLYPETGEPVPGLSGGRVAGRAGMSLSTRTKVPRRAQRRASQQRPGAEGSAGAAAFVPLTALLFGCAAHDDAGGSAPQP